MASSAGKAGPGGEVSCVFLFYPVRLGFKIKRPAQSL